tara:strand:- start:362 stop:640 length:279 start_codon:yes stop_codon:yes gene_type:complete
MVVRKVLVVVAVWKKYIVKVALNIEAEVVVDSSAKQVKDVCMSGKIGHPGGVLYQTLMHGLFKSADEGRSWSYRSDAPRNQRLPGIGATIDG